MILFGTFHPSACPSDENFFLTTLYLKNFILFFENKKNRNNRYFDVLLGFSIVRFFDFFLFGKFSKIFQTTILIKKFSSDGQADG